MKPKRIIAVGLKGGGEVAPGYVASGESIFSRNAARKKSQVKLTPGANRMKLGRQLYDSELIEEYQTRLKWLRCEVDIETNPTRLAKLKQQIEIKQRILDELKAGN